MHKATGPKIIRNPGSMVRYTIGFSRLKSEEEIEEEKVPFISESKDKLKDVNSENHEIISKTVDNKTVLTDSKPKVSAKVWMKKKD